MFTDTIRNAGDIYTEKVRWGMQELMEEPRTISLLGENVGTADYIPVAFVADRAGPCRLP